MMIAGGSAAFIAEGANSPNPCMAQSAGNLRKHSIVIPVFNQWPYTAACLQGLRSSGAAEGSIVVVDNASTDDTAKNLAAYSGINVIRNNTNRGCAGAWNQGVQEFPAEWTVLLNNDVLIPPRWLDGLISFAEEERIDVVSPAMCEGQQDYDFEDYSRHFMEAMAQVKRQGIAFGVCFMVRRRVFEALGLFDDDPHLGGYEDDEFFRRCRKNGFRLAVTGRSFLHHFGSITQKSIKDSLKKTDRYTLGDKAYYREKYGLTWVKRRRERCREKLLMTAGRLTERTRYGRTLWSGRRDGGFIWR
jgi:N-acetylglucosaminyl-diphospho-decaprenol L-rhamnosyltransferase